MEYTKAQKIAFVGLLSISAFLIGYSLKKKKPAKTKQDLRLRDVPLEIVETTTDPSVFVASGLENIPALFMRFDEENNDFILTKLNRPPKTPRQEQDTSEYSTYMRNQFNAPLYIIESDFLRLQELGLIPQNFPLNQIAFHFSYNERNQFLVGYSAPYTQTTSATPIQEVIRPIWAVSFEFEFETESTAPSYIDDVGLRTYGAKMLFAEGMLTRSNDGCHNSQGVNECFAEKAVLMQILMNRLSLRKEKRNPDATYQTIFDGPGQRWNASTPFMNNFNAGPTPLAQQRFNTFYEYYFWQMPAFAAHATNFIHFYAIQNTPSWVQIENMTPDVDVQTYDNTHPIRIGRTIVVDNSRTFQ